MCDADGCTRVRGNAERRLAAWQTRTAPARSTIVFGSDSSQRTWAERRLLRRPAPAALVEQAPHLSAREANRMARWRCGSAVSGTVSSVVIQRKERAPWPGQAGCRMEGRGHGWRRSHGSN